MDYAIKNSTERMIKANLEFVLGKYGYKICELGGQPNNKSMKAIYKANDDSMHEQPGKGKDYRLKEDAKSHFQEGRIIPCSRPHQWQDGKEYVEGKDYEIGFYVCGVSCFPNDKNCNNYCNADHSKKMPDDPMFYAFPSTII